MGRGGCVLGAHFDVVELGSIGKLPATDVSKSLGLHTRIENCRLVCLKRRVISHDELPSKSSIFFVGNFIPPLLIPSVNSLLDAMCCHLTSTSWDQLFRKALVSAGTVKKNVYTAYGIEGSATGQLFLEMLTDLIKLNNSCEDISLSLEELPLVEQIPILHRLDHSVHTVRMWMSSRCRNLAGKWDLDGFYCTYHTDISKCLQTLSTLQV